MFTFVTHVGGGKRRVAEPGKSGVGFPAAESADNLGPILGWTSGTHAVVDPQLLSEPLTRLAEPAAPGGLVQAGAIAVIGAPGQGGGTGGVVAALGREIVGEGRLGGEGLFPEPGGGCVVPLDEGETGELRNSAASAGLSAPRSTPDSR